MKINKAITFLTLSSILFITACAEDDKDSDGSGGSTADMNIEIQATTDEQGRATISFVSADVNKIGITANTDDNSEIRFTRIQAGSNNYLTPGGQTVSLGGSFARAGNTVSIPSRIVDPVPSKNTRFDIGVEVRNASGRSRPITFNITSRNDNNLNSGTLRLNIFHVGAVAAEETNRTAVAEALREARRIFSSAAGIDVSIQEFDIDGPINLPYPDEGGRLYLDASKNAPSPAINVFIGGDVEGEHNGSVLGIASGIPGPSMPSRKSAVIVSLFTSAGSDGRFSSEDIRVLAETIVHESAHQMGLFHPVDFSGSVAVGTDPLDDTDDCNFYTQCVNNDSLTSNLMFTNPVTDSSGSLIPQNRLSEGQRGVLNRYIAVD